MRDPKNLPAALRAPNDEALKVRVPGATRANASARAAAIGWTLSAVVRELLALPWPMEKGRKAKSNPAGGPRHEGG